MKKQIKIWMVSGPTGTLKEFRISCWMVKFLGGISFALILGVSWIFHDYCQLKINPYANPTLASTLKNQQDEITNQRKQIQSIANHIQILKQQVVSTTALENKVRIIADIEKPDEHSGFLGIGGIPLHNLNIDIPMESDHSILVREMHSQLKDLTEHTENQKLDLESLISQLEKKKNLLAATPTIRPAEGWVTSKFGYRKSPFTEKRDFHSGLDIANKIGTKIVATASGKVSFAGSHLSYGNIVKIDHGYGVVTKYAHLNKILVKRGQQVKRGETIGLLGNTGRSTGPHVHYEVVVNNIPVDPLKYILN